MSEHQAPQGSGHLEPAHESSDAKSRSVAAFELALLLLVVFSMVLMAGLFYYFTNRETAADTSLSPLATERVTPPAPNLQVSPAADLEQVRALEEARLNTYGWVDEGEQIVRIPIDKAMEIAAEHGLPKQLPPATGP